MCNKLGMMAMNEHRTPQLQCFIMHTHLCTCTYVCGYHLATLSSKRIQRLCGQITYAAELICDHTMCYYVALQCFIDWC